MGYIIENRQLAAQTRYQLRLFMRKLAAEQVEADVLLRAETSVAPLLALLADAVEDDVHPK